MPNSLDRLPVLQAVLAEAGIPIHGVAVISLVSPVQAEIDFKAEATQEQINAGNAILATFDWRRRRALARATVVAVLNQLSAGQQNAILRHMACDYLRNHPTVAAQIDAGLGTSLPVDEVDPAP